MIKYVRVHEYDDDNPWSEYQPDEYGYSLREEEEVDYEDYDDDDEDKPKYEEKEDKEGKNDLFVFIFLLSVMTRTACPLADSLYGEHMRRFFHYDCGECSMNKRTNYKSYHAFYNHCHKFCAENEDLSGNHTCDVWFHYAMLYYDYVLGYDNNPENKKLDINQLHRFDEISDEYIRQVKGLRLNFIPNEKNPNITQLILEWENDPSVTQKVSKKKF